MNGFEELFRREAFDSRLPFITPLKEIGRGMTSELGAEPARRSEDAASAWAAAVDRQVPPGAAAAVAQLLNEAREDRSEGFHDQNDDIADVLARVGVPRTVTVSCCRCAAHLEVTFMGFGDMVRRIEAVGWHLVLGRHASWAAWCSKCRDKAGSAA